MGRFGLRSLSLATALALAHLVGSSVQAAYGQAVSGQTPTANQTPAASQNPAANKTLVTNMVSVDGVDRSYRYFVSTKANSFTGQFVVFALHDNGQSAEQFAEHSGWTALAEAKGFSVVFPEAASKNTWAANSGGERNYVKAVFDHARTHLISRYPGDNLVVVGPNPTGVNGGNNPIWAWEPLRYLTGAGAGAVVAQEYAMYNPGSFAALATLNGAAFEGAYAAASEPAQAYFQHMRGKNVEPIWKQLKKEVPLSVWSFATGPSSTAQTRQASYWKAANAVGAAPETRSIEGFKTAVYRNAANDAQQVRETTLPADARYDAALASAIWNDFFSHVVRWTSSPNGALVSVLTEAEVAKQFEIRTIKVAGAEPYKYYLKLPSSYKRGQRLPLVLSTHGANEAAWLYISKTKMHEVGETEGFITVYPSGHRNRWASSEPAGPDADYIEALIKDVVKTYGADPTRVYMQGFSNGNAMTSMMGLTRPQLFAAISPNNGPQAFAKPVLDAAAAAKARYDYRLPMLIAYGSVDTQSTVDGRILAGGSIHQGIDTLKAYNNIKTPDAVERYNSRYTAPYDQLVLKGKLVPAGIDAHYPAGRFQIYDYQSADTAPRTLLKIMWIEDMPHAYDLRQAQLQWDYFKQWRRNANGSLSYVAP